MSVEDVKTRGEIRAKKAFYSFLGVILVITVLAVATNISHTRYSLKIQEAIPKFCPGATNLKVHVKFHRRQYYVESVDWTMPDHAYIHWEPSQQKMPKPMLQAIVDCQQYWDKCEKQDLQFVCTRKDGLEYTESIDDYILNYL